MHNTISKQQSTIRRGDRVTWEDYHGVTLKGTVIEANAYMVVVTRDTYPDEKFFIMRKMVTGVEIREELPGMGTANEVT